MSIEVATPSFKLGSGLEVNTSHVPFFITGTGRCGTTLMRRLVLERLPVVVPPENYTLGFSDRFLAKATSDWDVICDKVVEDLTSHTRNWKTYDLDGSEVLTLLKSVPEPARSIQNLWHAFHAIYAAKLGKPSTIGWGDKTPLNTKRVGNILRVFPEARFVFMVRDVFDVAYSYGSMLAKREGQYLQGAKRWVVDNKKILDVAAKRPDQTRIVMYEDLVREPEKILKKTVEFLGKRDEARFERLDGKVALDMATWPHLRNALEEVSTASIGNGRMLLAQEMKDEISEIAAALQARFGYEVTGVHNAEGARRRMALGGL
jgi:protein-tyrosine sulfotransferase